MWAGRPNRHLHANLRTRCMDSSQQPAHSTFFWQTSNYCANIYGTLRVQRSEFATHQRKRMEESSCPQKPPHTVTAAANSQLPLVTLLTTVQIDHQIDLPDPLLEIRLTAPDFDTFFESTKAPQCCPRSSEGRLCHRSNNYHTQRRRYTASVDTGAHRVRRESSSSLRR